MSDEKTTPAFEGWAVLELMGHRRIGGYVREVVLAGQGLLRVEMPADDAGAALTQFYSPSALYCLTPASEEAARAALRLARPEPVSQWEIEQARNRKPLALASAGDVPEGYEEPEEEPCGACGAREGDECAPDCTERELEQERPACEVCGAAAGEKHDAYQHAAPRDPEAAKDAQ